MSTLHAKPMETGNHLKLLKDYQCKLCTKLNNLRIKLIRPKMYSNWIIYWQT